jgi:hypothetical protein
MPAENSKADEEPAQEVYPDNPSPFRAPPPRSLLARVVPLSRQLRGYRSATALREMLAGATVAALAVPAAMADAELAGVSLVNGLYALLLPTVAYALLGSSRQLVIGPEGSISALVAVSCCRSRWQGAPTRRSLRRYSRCWSARATSSRSSAAARMAGRLLLSPGIGVWVWLNLDQRGVAVVGHIPSCCRRCGSPSRP